VRGPLDEARFVQSIERAIDLGCNFIDCSNGYGYGQSETILGKVIKGKRDNLIITSKVFSKIGPGPNDRGLSRYHIMGQVEQSLRKLQTDRIDLYYMHHPDPETELEETLRTMEDLVRQGKVRYIGASNHTGRPGGRAALGRRPAGPGAGCVFTEPIQFATSLEDRDRFVAGVPPLWPGANDL
jgi:aryl-alcohol dehydrogenase-like predicted oxidoreductase